MALQVKWHYLLRGWLPERHHVKWTQWLWRALGAFLALWSSAVISHWVLGEVSPWLIAPMGASAVLLFAVPASPLAQPWPMLAGNLLSALIGISVARFGGDGGLAAACSVALAIAAMAWCRCLHPPGGALALSCVVGGPSIHALGYSFLWHPVALNVMLMLVGALLINNAMGIPFPHHAAVPESPHGTRDPLPSQRAPWVDQDLQDVLDHYGEELDVGIDDLRQLILRVEAHAVQHRLSGVLCRDIMSCDVISVRPETSIAEAWRKLRDHRVKLLPVVAPDGVLLGVVTLADLLRSWSPESSSVLDWQAPARSLMVAQPHCVLADATAATLAERFTDQGYHHLPVVDESRRVVGMVSQSDLLACALAFLAYSGHAPNSDWGVSGILCKPVVNTN